MMVTTLVSLAAATSWFPLEPGTEWTYRIDLDGGVYEHLQVCRIEPSIVIEEKSVAPMSVKVGTRELMTYYAIEGGFVVVAAFATDDLLPKPVPVLPVDPEKGRKWEFSGESEVLGGPAATKSTSVVKGFETLDVLGKPTRAVVVETESVAGGGSTALRTRSIEYYAEGIGMVQRVQTNLSQNGGSATYVLTDFKKPSS